MQLVQMVMLGGAVIAAMAAGVIMALLVGRFYIKVEQGKALIVNRKGREPEVTFVGAVVWPIYSQAEMMDISVKTIELDRRGKEGLICRDNIRADIRVTFFVRVNMDPADVIKVGQSIGCVRASDPATLEELFMAKFSEALKTAGKQLDFVDLYTKRKDFRDNIMSLIGTDLSGFVLEDAAIDYLEQTPLAALDPNNILDAEGIRKITQLTADQHIETNKFSNNERKQIKKQDVEANEIILNLDRQQADAQARQTREIETMRAREQGQTQTVQAEENLKVKMAQIKADEQMSIETQNRNREVEVAEKNRERVVAIETERVERDRMLEAISREREVELQRISKEKALEEERMRIQEVIRQRIAVEKTVAEEEERIKGLRIVEEAKRKRESAVIAAEAEAQEAAVKQVRAAEAAEQAARLKAAEQTTLAQAKLDASEKEAAARIKVAQAAEVEAAAVGLAQAKVKEAEAQATEKLGMAQVRVKEADAPAVEKLGMAEVAVSRAQTDCEADAIRQKLIAEAEGLAEKAKSLALLEQAGRQHEEFRLQLEAQRDLGLERLHVQKDIAASQAAVLAEALKAAKINIVGGDGSFMEKMVNAISLGKGIDGFVENSAVANTVLHPYLSGKGNLVQDVKDILSRPALSTGDLQNLSVVALLSRLAQNADGEGRAKLQTLLEAARSLGIEDGNPPAS